jgi:hypothetical protein
VSSPGEAANAQAAAAERAIPRRAPEGVVAEGEPRASAYICQAVSCLSAQAQEIATGLALQVA